MSSLVHGCRFWGSACSSINRPPVRSESGAPKGEQGAGNGIRQARRQKHPAAGLVGLELFLP